MAANRLPLNLPHAAKVSMRIVYHIRGLSESTMDDAHRGLIAQAEALVDLLGEVRMEDDNPPEPRASQLAAEAAAQGRLIVDGIERLKIGTDRLGQAVRNLFECLALGEEGAEISLRAGEDPKSLMRPA